MVSGKQGNPPNRVVLRYELLHVAEILSIILSMVKPIKKKTLGIVALKHKVVLDNLIKKVGKGGKTTMCKAMQDAGYSKTYSESGNIKKKKNWTQLTEKYLPDETLLQKHSKLIDFSSLGHMVFGTTIKDKDIEALLKSTGCVLKQIVHGQMAKQVYYWQPDGRIRKDAIEMAYKVKGKNAPEKFEVEQTGLMSLSDQELADLIKKQKARFNKTD